MHVVVTPEPVCRTLPMPVWRQIRHDAPNAGQHDRLGGGLPRRPVRPTSRRPGQFWASELPANNSYCCRRPHVLDPRPSVRRRGVVAGPTRSRLPPATCPAWSQPGSRILLRPASAAATVFPALNCENLACKKQRGPLPGRPRAPSATTLCHGYRYSEHRSQRRCTRFRTRLASAARSSPSSATPPAACAPTSSRPSARPVKK